MPIRRLVDAGRKKGRCDADEKGRCRPEWPMLRRILTRPEKPERQTVGIPEGPGILGNSGTQSRRPDLSEKYQNTEQSEYRLVRKHRRLVQKTSKHRRVGTSNLVGNIGSSTQAGDIREPRHPEEGESEGDTKSETGSVGELKTQSQEPREATANAGKAWSLAGPKLKSQRARRASS
jgi:hypothetical protein